jgi:PAS domain S-box-containing protein
MYYSWSMMAQPIAAQGDFLVFVQVFSFILCALESIILEREEGAKRRWLLFFGFFLLQGVEAIWVLVAPAIPAEGRSPLVSPFVRSLAYGTLIGFVIPFSVGRWRKLLALALTIAVVLALFAVGLARGASLFSFLSHLVLGVAGAVLAVRFLLTDRALRGEKRPWLVGFIVSFALLGGVQLTQSVVRLFGAGGAAREFSLPLTVLSLALAFTLSLHELRSFARLNRGFGRAGTRVAIFFAFMLLPLILFLGWLAASKLGDRSESGLRAEYQTNANVVQTAIEVQTGELDRDVLILSGSRNPSLFLSRRDKASLSLIQDTLDRSARAIGGECYLLDRDGFVVAASQGAPHFFAATRHADAQWFADAIGGGAGRYFSVDLSVHVRGYFASSPVWDPVAGITGVALIVRSLVTLLPPVPAGQDVFLADQSGMVVLASLPNLYFRALWPQPGAAPSREAPLLPSKPATGETVPWNGSRYLATRVFLSIPGMSIVHLGPVDEVLLYRLAGWLATILITLLTAAFSAAAQMSLLDEAHVERSESRYRALVEGTPDWISIVDAAGAFLFTNRAGRESLGIAEARVPDGRIEGILGPKSIALMIGRIDVAMRGTVVVFEEALPSADGRTRTWNITLVPLQHAEGTGAAILIGHDITEHRQTEKRLVRAERLAALGTLAAGVAHQFNNINAVAMGYVEIMEGEAGLPEKWRRYLGSVREALERSVNITSRLLPLAARSAGEVPLSEAVTEVLPSLRPDLEREGVSLELDLGEGALISLGREQLDFVIVTLMVNAWHAVLGQAERRIRVSTGTNDGLAFLRVQDTGIGIAPDKLSSLFTPFFSEKGEHAQPQSPMARVRGVGLSLAVAHSIVAGREGRIDVESEVGVGSTFTVWLPSGSGQQPK